MHGATIVEGVKVTGVTRPHGRVAGVDVALGATAKERSPAKPWSTAAASGRASSGALPASTCRCIPPSISTWSPRPIPGVAPGHAGDPRSRRLPLLQGGGRRSRDGRLRAEGEALERRPDPRRLRVPAAARGLGPVRDPDAQCDPPHAVPRDRRDQAAAERSGKLHARRQLHSRRGAGARRLLRLRGLQLRRHRQRRRRRQARRRMDRQRRSAALDLWDVDTRRFAPFHANRKHLADRTVESLGLHYAMRWPREELSPPSGRCAARRSTIAWPRRARCSARR